MTVLDTHIWVWWVHGNAQLPSDYNAYPHGLVAP